MREESCSGAEERLREGPLAMEPGVERVRRGHRVRTRPRLPRVKGHRVTDTWVAADTVAPWGRGSGRVRAREREGECGHDRFKKPPCQAFVLAGFHMPTGLAGQATGATGGKSVSNLYLFNSFKHNFR